MLRANQDIADLSIYGLGVANNGGGTDGVEYRFASRTVSAGSFYSFELNLNVPFYIKKDYLFNKLNAFMHIILIYKVM